MKTAVIYARVSSSNDRQDTSRQIEDLKKYAISQDIEIVNIFQEHISGAKRIEERQILGECLEYCKRESVNILLLSELSRLGRSTLQVLRSLDILHESKVSVYIQNLGLYTLQPNGEVNPIASIMVTVLAEMANIERSNIQYRLNSGRANYIAKGGKLGRKTGSTKTDDKKKEEQATDGTLYCAGMIAGEGLVGILLAILAVVNVSSVFDLSGSINLGNAGGVILMLLMILSLLKFSIWNKKKA